MQQEPAILNLRYILSDLEFSLSTDLEEGMVDKGLVMLKHIPSKEYMLVTSEQLIILKRFRKKLSVSRLIPTLIEDRKCPALQELYELILQAIKAGILESEKIRPTGNRAIAAEWNLKLSLKWGVRFAFFSIIFGLGSLWLTGLKLPIAENMDIDLLTVVTFIALGHLSICAAISLGYFLSACLLRNFHHEVYDVSINWKHLFPHFYVDISDACMSGRHRESSIAFVQLAPIFMFAGVIAHTQPAINFILLLGFFQATQPHRNSSAWLLLKSLFKRKILSTENNPLFPEPLTWMQFIVKKYKKLDKKFLFISSVYTLLWGGLLGYFFIKLFQFPATIHITSWISQGYHWYFIIFIALLGLLTVFYHYYNCIKGRTKPHPPVRKRKADLQIDSAHNPGLTQDRLVNFLRDCLLFQDLSDDELYEIADRLDLRLLKRKQFAFQQGDSASELHIVANGRVEMMTDLKSGRPVRIAELGAGEVFGEKSAIFGSAHTRSIRALKTTWCLVMKTEDFKELLINRIGFKRLRIIVEKHYFMHRIPLCKEWTKETMVRFAQIATFSRFKPGEQILTRGHTNKFFYVVHEGTLEVRIEGKALSRLQSGDFFGEISLLQNSMCVADVVTVTESRCLIVSRADFLAMIGNDYRFGLQFERIASKRLKRPIFPLKPGINYSESALR